jgi:hypothetical protein
MDLKTETRTMQLNTLEDTYIEDGLYQQIMHHYKIAIAGVDRGIPIGSNGLQWTKDHIKRLGIAFDKFRVARNMPEMHYSYDLLKKHIG